VDQSESEWHADLTIDKLIAEMDKALQFLAVMHAGALPLTTAGRPRF